jgi:hypothetical protein
MAKEVKTVIPMPTLDNAEGKCRLVLTTMKGSRGLNSCAYIEYAMPGGGSMFEMCGDFRRYFPSVKLPATEKNLSQLHAADFGAEAVEKLTADVTAFYAEKAARAAS